MKHSLKAVYWLETANLLNEVYVHSRSFVSDYSKLASSKDLENFIYKEHIYIEKKELLEILDACKNHTDFEPRGIGVELGSGCAAISVELAKHNRQIEGIYAIEIVPAIVEYAAIPLISMNNMEGRVIPIVGSFDQINLQEESVDFIIEFDSLHHSFDLAKTISESARVLKPGGNLLAIDRSHWKTSKVRRAELENTVYSKEFLEARGLDNQLRLTRAENGEHEYLLSEYLEAFLEAGFKKVDWVFLVDPKLSVIKQALISALPSIFRKNTKYFYVQTWPLRKLLIPIIMMRIFRITKFGRYINFPRNKNSNRFQCKTVIIATR